MNIILVSLDGVRVDVAYSERFPTLASLCREGVVFEHVVAQAPLTPISHASILTGLLPPHHGIRHLFLEQLSNNTQTLPEILHAHGYTTHAVVSCPGLHQWYGMHRGFDTYDDQLPSAPDGRDALHTVDVKARGTAAKDAWEVVTKSVDLLDRVKAHPFFLFIHFFDAHWPYEPPAPFDTQYKDNPYEGEVAHIDRALGELLAAADQRGLRDDLLLIVLADHGEDLEGLYPNDHGGARGHPEEQGHGCLLYDTTQLVPLIMVFPQSYGYHGRVQQQVRLIDVAPTVVDLLGIPTTARFDGVSLRGHLEGRGRDLVAYSETHYPRESVELLERFPHLHNLKAVRIRTHEVAFKVIWHLESDQVEVYDLVNDPFEQTNLLVALPGIEVLSEPSNREIK